MHIKGLVPVAAFLVQDALVLCGSNPPPRTNANMDTAPIAHGGRISWLDRNDCHLGAAQHALGYGQSWGRDDIALCLDVGHSDQDLVRDRQATGINIVPCADEHNTGTTMMEEIVGERADGLPHRSPHIPSKRFLALNLIGLQVNEHLLELFIQVGGDLTDEKHSCMTELPEGLCKLLAPCKVC